MARPHSPRCSGCKKRIPRSETDAVLRRLDSERKRYYLSRCIPAALARIRAGQPEAWLLTVRHRGCPPSAPYHRQGGL